MIAEDHLMVRAGIRALLEKVADINILGEASNGQEALNTLHTLKPHILITDIVMPVMDGE